MMACFEAETFLHMWLNFRGTKCDSFFRNLANPEYPFAMWLLMVKNPIFNTISSLNFNTLNTLNSSMVFTHLFCVPLLSKLTLMVQLSHLFIIEMCQISQHRDFLFARDFCVPHFKAH